MKIRLLLILFLGLSVFACAQSQVAGKKSTEKQSGDLIVRQTIKKTPADQVVYEVLGRLEQLQQEVKQLRGQLEVQSYTIDDLKKRQKSVLTDLDLRLQMLEVSGGISEKPVSGSDSLLPEIEKSIVPPAEKPINKKVTGIEKQVYLAAYENLRNGHYNQAISMLKQVITDYPNGEYADNAQYWLGEAYKVNQEVNTAKAAFEKVIHNYPESSKVPDAMLKLAYIEIEQHNPHKAREYLIKILDDYRDTTAARLAETKLMQLDGGNQH